MAVDRVVSYAQNREDVLIGAFFEDVKRGFYVDIGANHPTDDSVTKYFYDKGWRGINVEPNSRLFSLLEQSRPRDINVRVGISDKEGKLAIREYEGWYAGLSTFSKDMQKENKSITVYRDIEVDVITLKKLFEDNKTEKINFLKVDVEGYEYNVLISNDWKKYRPELICIEANHTFKDWRSLLKKAKYTEVFFDGLNEYYLAEEVLYREENFSYVKSVIGAPIIDARVEKHIQALQYRLGRQQGELNSYKSEILQLKREVLELKKVAPLVKQLFKSLDGSMRRRIERLNTIEEERLRQFHLDTETVRDYNDLLSQIRLYDLDVYYSMSSKKSRLLYRVVSRTYEVLFGVVFATGKGLLRVTRRVRR